MKKIFDPCKMLPNFFFRVVHLLESGVCFGPQNWFPGLVHFLVPWYCVCVCPKCRAPRGISFKSASEVSPDAFFSLGSQGHKNQFSVWKMCVLSSAPIRFESVRSVWTPVEVCVLHSAIFCPSGHFRYCKQCSIAQILPPVATCGTTTKNTMQDVHLPHTLQYRNYGEMVKGCAQQWATVRTV